MLPFKVRRFAGRSGEQIDILTDRFGQPHFYPNAYATAVYRNAGKAPNTTARVLRSLGLAVMWGQTEGRDLDHELSVGSFLSEGDAERLVSFLALTADDQAEILRASQSPSGTRRYKVVKLEDVRPSPQTLAQQLGKKTSDAESGARIRWVANYLEWHLKRRLHTLKVSKHPPEPLKSNAEASISRMRTLAPKVSGFADDDRTLEAPDQSVILAIERLMRPNSCNNPFTPGFVQTRNYLLWRLYLDSGARRAEVWAATSKDVIPQMRQFRIRESKTLPRTTPIRARTAEAFDRYFMDFWVHLPGGSDARKKGLICVDRQGRQLSHRAINRVFEKARARVAQSHQKISPHAMRRFWNDSFSRSNDAAPPSKRLSEREEAEFRMRFMGWSNPETAQRYNKRHIIEKGNKISQMMMDDTPNFLE